MDGNKDEALRCVKIAEAAIASGDKQRSLKFIKIAQRLNNNVAVDDLLASCAKLDSENSKAATDQRNSHHTSREYKPSSSSECINGQQNYTAEHVNLIREVKRNNDYYSILGVKKSCSVEEIRKAYKKLSLKYDQTGLVEDFEYNQQHNVRRRRRRTTNEFFHDDFDPDEIFRSFFGQSDIFRNSHVYRTATRGTTPSQPREDVHGGFNIMILLQFLPILIIFLLAYMPFSEPEYSLQKTYAYQHLKFTEKYGVEFYVKSPDFDEKYPIGSHSRENIEDHVVKDYKNMLGRYCHVELQRRQWNRNYPTPHCDKLQNFGVA
ncbi:chaperone protein dnaJ [Thalictrum thalictroides]|uniref:Chaperone protein dnaJ n=1 Tax=Thalictrum thalictroides TaxID=46969 RepID=A0A7J6W2G2_THATH|nr:chaperone protein dnaJ [Thalictrum thalictroides]